MAAQTEEYSGPWILPVIYYRMKRYFVDLKLRQFREIEDPQNWPDFDSEQGRRMCRQSGVITCPACGLSVIIPTARRDEDLRCMVCFSRIPR